MNFSNRRIMLRNCRWLLRLTLIFVIDILTGCSDEQSTTWEDIKTLKIKTSMDGVGFDVPLNYHYGEYARNIYNWPTVSKEIREGKTRSSVDFIKIYALLPELEPLNEENLKEFMELGWGRTIDISITHSRSFEYFFQYSASNILERLPDVTDVSGMLHYRDKDNGDDIFLSHDHAVPELTRIRCAHAKSGQSPHCDVETLYRYEINVNIDGGISQASHHFYLKYSFSRNYLPQWRLIDQKIKTLYDLFAKSAEQQH